jgi:hypothetical protein
VPRARTLLETKFDNGISCSLQTSLEKILAEIHLTVSLAFQWCYFFISFEFPFPAPWIEIVYTIARFFVFDAHHKPMKAEDMPEPSWIAQLQESALSRLSTL